MRGRMSSSSLTACTMQANGSGIQAPCPMPAAGTRTTACSNCSSLPWTKTYSANPVVRVGVMLGLKVTVSPSRNLVREPA